MVTKRASLKTTALHPVAKRPTNDGITDAKAREIYDFIRETFVEIGKSLVRLKPIQRRGMLRKPPKSDSIMALIVTLARERHMLVEPAGETRLEKAALLAERLAMPVAAMENLRQAMADTMRVAEAESWGETAALYTALASIARYDVVLGARLAPAKEFFKKRRRGSGKSTPSKREPKE